MFKKDLITNIRKWIIIFIFIPIIFSSAFSENNYVFKSLGVKNIITPQKIILVKISPKISDTNKFLESIDNLFVDQLKLNQSIFTYVVIGENVFKMRDLDVSYSSNVNDEKISYIAYTDQIPNQLISKLESVFSIKDISIAKIEFKKNIFNITETDTKIDNISPLKPSYVVTDPKPEYNSTPQPASLEKVNIKFKNVSDYPLFKSDPSNVIALCIKDGKEVQSSMFLNEKWYSKSRAGSVIEDRIGSNEIGNISLPVQVSPVAGEQLEKFVLARPDGYIYPNTEFEIKFIVPDIGQKIIEVKDTGLGFVNIRDEAKSNSKIIGFAYSGTKILVVEDAGTWMKIKFDGEKTGWILSSYAKKLY
ncbi:MAG: SH3 domain-containing protein [bacterium]